VGGTNAATPTQTPPETPPPKGGQPKGRRKSQVPENFTPDAAQRAWAVHHCPNVDLAAETAKFVDHHRAKGTTFLDPQLGFRTWLRRIPLNGSAINGHQATPSLATLARCATCGLFHTGPCSGPPNPESTAGGIAAARTHLRGQP
jgi:hypothetical protein